MITEHLTLSTWLRDAGKNLPYNECIYLVRAMCEVEILDMDLELPPIAQVCLNWALQKRVQNIPLAKILKKKNFYNNTFITTDFTLDPRPETESLIDAISIKPRTILELGVGTGCLILSALKLFEKDPGVKAHGIGIDISKDALQIAEENAQILRVKRIHFIENNWANELEDKLPAQFKLKKSLHYAIHFDLILCNPPYVDVNAALSEETLKDPTLALFGDASTYRAVLESLKNISFYELIFEIPQNLIAEVEQMLKDKIINFDAYSFKEINNSQIYILKIENHRNF